MKAEMEGIVAAGAQAVDIGECTTSLFNFAVTGFPEHEAGVMITASHNPAQYNGFKVYEGSGLHISGVEMHEWIDRVESAPDVGAGLKPARRVPSDASATMHEVVLSAYIQKLLSLVPPPALKGKKIVIDAGNGMASVVLNPLFERLDVEMIPMYFDPDGNFPHHEANPIKFETLKDLQAKMKEVGADLGVAFDGDADRILFLDENAEPINGDVMLGLLATARLKVHPGAAVVWSPNASWAIRDAIAKSGGKSVWEKVGRAHFPPRVLNEKGAMGGEVSAHYFYPEFQGLESVDFTMLLVLQMLAQSTKPMSQIIAPYRTYVATGERNFEVEDKDGAIARLKAAYAPGASLVNELDGVRIEYTDWWFNIRKSNTEPLVRLNLEAVSHELMMEKFHEAEKIIMS